MAAPELTNVHWELIRDQLADLSENMQQMELEMPREAEDADRPAR